MTEALVLGDRIAVMKEGSIVQIGAPKEIYTNPANDYVANIIHTPKDQIKSLEKIIILILNKGYNEINRTTF